MSSATYLDIKKYADQTDEICLKVNTLWCNVAKDAIIDYMIAPETAASRKKAKKQLVDCSQKVADIIGEFVANTVMEAYQHGYSEGAHDAEQECVKHYHKLVDKGYLPGDAKTMKFMELVKKTSTEHFQEAHKGESLQINVSDILGDLNKK